MLSRIVGGFKELPLLYRIIFVVLVVGIVFGLTFWWNWKIAVWGLAIVAGVGLLLFLIQFLVKRWEKRRNAELAVALESEQDNLAAIPDEERRQAIAEVRDQWNRAVNELKNTGMNLYSLPWYMLIGEPACGKSTTLKNSGMEFPVGNEALSGAGGTRNCDWWFTNEAVILDTAGRFTFEERNAPDADEWKEFLGLLKKYRPRCPISGVIVAIPANSLLSDPSSELEDKAKIIREKLTQLEQELEVQFPVYIVVTKCDLVLGFAEFFQRLPALEQRQLFGWSKEAPHDEPFQVESWSKIFRGISQRLHLWRNRFLVDDSEAGDVDRLYAFPDEFMALEEPLQRYLGEIFVDNRYADPLFFRGMYFTSGLQKGKPIVKACANLLRAASGGPDEMDLSQIFQKSTAFFVRDFYRKKLFREQGLIQPTRVAMKRRRVIERVGYGSAGILGVILITLLIYGGMTQGGKVESSKEAVENLRIKSSEWSNKHSTNPGAGLAALPLDEARVFAEDFHEVANGKLNPTTLQTVVGLGVVGDVRNDMANSYKKLTGETVFRVVGEYALKALRQKPPTSWAEREEYLRAARTFLELIRDENPEGDRVPATAEERRELYWGTLTPILQLAQRRVGLSEADAEKFEAQYQQLLDVCHDGRFPRPNLRPYFFAGAEGFQIKEAVDNILGNYEQYWMRTADGNVTALAFQTGEPPTLAMKTAEGAIPVANAPAVESLPQDVQAGLIWLRAAAINRGCAQVYEDILELDTNVKDLPSANQLLGRWSQLLAPPRNPDLFFDVPSFFARMEEAEALEAWTEAKPLLDYPGAIESLMKIWKEDFALLKELSPDRASEWSYEERIDNALRDLDVRYNGAKNDVKTNLSAGGAAYSILNADEVDSGTRTARLRFQPDFSLRSGALGAVHAAVVANVQDRAYLDTLQDLHRDLEKQLQALDAALGVAKEALKSDEPTKFQKLTSHVDRVTQLAREVLVANSLDEYGKKISVLKPEDVTTLTLAFCENPEIETQVLRLNDESYSVKQLHAAAVAREVLTHGDLLFDHLANVDPRYLGTERRESIGDEITRVLRAYLKDYQTAWDKIWTDSFESTLPQDTSSMTWTDFRRQFARGFGLAEASNEFAESIQRTITVLREHIDLDDVPRKTVGPDGIQPDFEARIGPLDRSYGNFRRAFELFLKAYQRREAVAEATAEGDPAADPATPTMIDPLERLVSSYTEFYKVANRLQNPTQFRPMLQESVSDKSRQRDQMALCEELFQVDQFPDLESDRVGAEVLRIVQTARQIIERELVKQFDSEWDELGDAYRGDRLHEVAPFRENPEAPPPEVRQEVFKRFYGSVHELRERWYILYLAEELPLHKVCLRLPGGRKTITEFIESVEQLGIHFGFNEGGEPKIEAQLTANFQKDPLGASDLEELASRRLRITDFKIRFGLEDKEFDNKGRIAEKVEWTYGPRSHSLYFEMFRDASRVGDRWPAQSKYRDGWLSLARTLWEETYRNVRSTDEVWLIEHTVMGPSDNKPYKAFHKLVLPAGRGIPARPDFSKTKWKTSQ